MKLCVVGIGVWSPSIGSWPALRARLLGSVTAISAANVPPAGLPPANWLPPAERRRATTGTRVVLSVAEEALTQAGFDPVVTPSVFTSSAGSPETTDPICAQIAGGDTQISPIRFHNSVHNAAAGYYSIAVGCRESSTSIAAHDASAAAGLLEAAAQLDDCGGPLLFVSFDVPYTGSLVAARPIAESWAIALALLPSPAAALATLELTVSALTAEEAHCADPHLEFLRTGNPTARLLPLLGVIAGGASQRVTLALPTGGSLAIDVKPC